MIKVQWIRDLYRTDDDDFSIDRYLDKIAPLIARPCLTTRLGPMVTGWPTITLRNSVRRLYNAEELGLQIHLIQATVYHNAKPNTSLRKINLGITDLEAEEGWHWVRDKIEESPEFSVEVQIPQRPRYAVEALYEVDQYGRIVL